MGVENSKNQDTGLEDLFRRVIEEADEEAFAEIYASTEKLFFRRAISLLRSRGLAENALQDAYLKMFRYRASFQVGRRFLPWAYAVLDKASLDVRSRNSSGAALSIDAIPDPEDPRGEERSELEEIEEAMARLPLRQRKAIRMRAELGYSYREIGARLGCTVSAVAELLYRARTRLRRELLGVNRR